MRFTSRGRTIRSIGVGSKYFGIRITPPLGASALATPQRSKKMDPVIRERWFDLSLPEQMVNIGNEVKRAVRFDEDNQKKRAFIKKALEYIELTMDDPKNKTVIPEIKIGKEILEDYVGDHVLNYTKEQIRDYYLNLL